MSSDRGWRAPGPALLAAALLLTAPPSLSAQEPGDSLAPYLDAELLAAWEEQLRADPRTVHLEEIGPGRYRYATRLFPFDGELQVLATAVDDRSGAMGGYDMGVVETELVGVSDDFRRRYGRSLAIWEQRHMLYRGDDGEWVDQAGLQELLQDQYVDWNWIAPGWLAFLSTWLWPLILIVAIVAVVIVMRKAMRQVDRQAGVQDRALEQGDRSMELSEESLAISRDSNRVLHEILEELRSGGGGPSA